MGVWTPLPSETDRNLDFSILKEEAVGPGFLVPNLEGTGESEFRESQNAAAQIPGSPPFFLLPTPRNYNSLASVEPSALCITSCTAALSARAQSAVGPHRGLPQPRPLHLSPLCYPRVTEATRGLRLPACVARTPAHVPR